MQVFLGKKFQCDLGTVRLKWVKMEEREEWGVIRCGKDFGFYILIEKDALELVEQGDDIIY